MRKKCCILPYTSFKPILNLFQNIDPIRVLTDQNVGLLYIENPQYVKHKTMKKNLMSK